MGIGDGVSQSIFFVAGITIAAAVVVVAYGAVQGLSGDITAHAEDLGKRLRSEVRIVNDPAHVATSPLTILAKNVGKGTLHPALWTVLYDGAAETNLTITVVGGSDNVNLGEAEIASIAVNGLTVASGDHTVRVVTETGTYDDFQFHA